MSNSSRTDDLFIYLFSYQNISEKKMCIPNFITFFSLLFKVTPIIFVSEINR